MRIDTVGLRRRALALRSGAAEVPDWSRYASDPVGFHRDVLRRPEPTAGQVRLLESLRDHPFTIAPGGHSIGKSWILASGIVWYLCTRRPSKVVLTAAGWTSLIGVLYAGVRSCWRPSLMGVPALNDRIVIGPEHYLVCISTTEPERLQGHHGPNVLVVLDESPGIKDPILTAVTSLGADRIVALGNPTRATGWFREFARRAERGEPGLNLVHLPASMSPAAHLTRAESVAAGLGGLTDKDWLDAAERDFGRDSVYWRTRVEARFPESDDLAVFEAGWLDACLAAPRPTAWRSCWISVDLAGKGRDRSVVLIRSPDGVAEVWSSATATFDDVADRVLKARHDYLVPGNRVVYDATGVGFGFDGYLRPRGIHDAIPFYGAQGGGDLWTNQRTASAILAARRLDPRHAEARPFWMSRDVADALRPELLGLRLVPDLTDVRKLRLEAKDELKGRLGRSPDVGDAFCMSFLTGDDLTTC